MLVGLFLIYRSKGRCCFPAPGGIFLTVHSRSSLWSNGETGGNKGLCGETNVAVDFEFDSRYCGCPHLHF